MNDSDSLKLLTPDDLATDHAHAISSEEMNNAIAKTVQIAVGAAKQKRVKLAALQTAVDSGDPTLVMLAAKNCLRTEDDRKECDRVAPGEQRRSSS